MQLMLYDRDLFFTYVPQGGASLKSNNSSFEVNTTVSKLTVTKLAQIKAQMKKFSQ